VLLNNWAWLLGWATWLSYRVGLETVIA